MVSPGESRPPYSLDPNHSQEEKVLRNSSPMAVDPVVVLQHLMLDMAVDSEAQKLAGVYVLGRVGDHHHGVDSPCLGLVSEVAVDNPSSEMVWVTVVFAHKQENARGTCKEQILRHKEKEREAVYTWQEIATRVSLASQTDR